jgi:hypothetical protein
MEPSASSPGFGGAGPRCRSLRSKGMFIEVEPDPSIPNMHDGFFWCRHTLNCLGPDGAVADARRCQPGRPCFEE